jgi:hypothetical protein
MFFIDTNNNIVFENNTNNISDNGSPSPTGLNYSTVFEKTQRTSNSILKYLLLLTSLILSIVISIVVKNFFNNICFGCLTFLFCLFITSLLWFFFFTYF